MSLGGQGKGFPDNLLLLRPIASGLGRNEKDACRYRQLIASIE